MAELQKDPITRSDFIGFTVFGGLIGAALTIPPIAFLLHPVIDVDVLGETDVDQEYQEVGPISEVPADEPVVFNVDFPIRQTYGDEEIQDLSGQGEGSGTTLTNAVWLSWRTETDEDGHAGESFRPEWLDETTEGLTPEQISEAEENLNILSNSCAHLGCPVRWVLIEGEGEFLCPCHGGIYDINGGYVAGPPPRDMYRYVDYEVRENGRLYIRHEYDAGSEYPENGPQQPYVV